MYLYNGVTPLEILDDLAWARGFVTDLMNGRDDDPLHIIDMHLESIETQVRNAQEKYSNAHFTFTILSLDLYLLRDFFWHHGAWDTLGEGRDLVAHLRQWYQFLPTCKLSQSNEIICATDKYIKTLRKPTREQMQELQNRCHELSLKNVSINLKVQIF